MVVNTSYNSVTKMRLTFDGQAPETIELLPGAALQTFTFPAHHVTDHVGVELLDRTREGEAPPSQQAKPDNIGLNVLRLHVSRPPEIAARVQPLADPGVLVRYPRGHGGILLMQLRPSSAAEREARVSEAATHAGDDQATRDKAAAEMRLWLLREADGQVKLLRQLLWNLGLE